MPAFFSIPNHAYQFHSSSTLLSPFRKIHRLRLWGKRDLNLVHERRCCRVHLGYWTVSANHPREIVVFGRDLQAFD